MTYDTVVSTHKELYHIVREADEIRVLSNYGFEFDMPEEDAMGKNMRKARIRGPIIKKFGSTQNFMSLCQQFGEIVLKEAEGKFYAQIYNP